MTLGNGMLYQPVVTYDAHVAPAYVDTRLQPGVWCIVNTFTGAQRLAKLVQVRIAADLNYMFCDVWEIEYDNGATAVVRSTQLEPVAIEP